MKTPQRRSDKRTEGFYRSREWFRLRHAIEKARGRICEVCHAPDNIRLLCASCHSRKTAQYDNGFGNRERQKQRSGAGEGCYEDGTPRVAKNPHW